MKSKEIRLVSFLMAIFIAPLATEHVDANNCGYSPSNYLFVNDCTGFYCEGGSCYEVKAYQDMAQNYPASTYCRQDLATESCDQVGVYPIVYEWYKAGTCTGGLTSCPCDPGQLWVYSGSHTDAAELVNHGCY